MYKHNIVQLDTRLVQLYHIAQWPKKNNEYVRIE